MNEPTALAETKKPAALDRGGEARHTNKRLLRREVHDLEAIQAFQRLDGDPPLHTDARCQVSKVDCDAAGVFLDHPS